MRFADLAPVNDRVKDMELLYGKFDIGLDGTPTDTWRGRNLKKLRPPIAMTHAYFPGTYISRVTVNRRMLGAIGNVFNGIVMKWTPEAQRAHGLDQFVKCYSFGEGSGPSLFWYGAAWELSPAVTGEILGEVIQIFIGCGFTYAGVGDKKKIRIFEFW